MQLKSINSFILLLLFCTLFSIESFSQSSSQYRRTGILNYDKLSFVFTNYGVVAQPRSEGPGFAWRGDNNEYLGDNSLIIGIELPIKDYNGNGTPDTIHSVIVTPVSRPGGGDYAPGGKFWGFEPVGGFFNPDINPSLGVAVSTNPSTWPNIWPDKPEYGTGIWNGLYGANSFVGAEESYFQMDDRNDEKMFFRHNFLPDSLHPEIKGHGIRVSVRYIISNVSDLTDLVFKIYDIKNESAHGYHKVFLGELTGTYIGGNGDEWNNDVSLYYPKDDIIVSNNFEKTIRKSANPHWKGLPYLIAQGIISAPTGNRIASYSNFVPANAIIMNKEEEMWNHFKPGKYSYPSSVFWTQDSIPYAVRGEDGDYLFGTDYFTLAPGEVKRIVVFTGLGKSKDDLIQKKLLAEALFNSNFDSLSFRNQVKITSPMQNEVISGVKTIQWNSFNANEYADIWISTDAGTKWELTAKNIINNGFYQFNTNEFDDAKFAKIRVFIKNQNFQIKNVAESFYFSIKNTNLPKPFVKILDDLASINPITSNNLSLTVLIGNTVDNSMKLEVQYGLSQDTLFYTAYTVSCISDTANQILNIDLRPIPNSTHLYLKLKVRDGGYYSDDITDQISKYNPRTDISPNHLLKISGNAESKIEIRALDSLMFSGKDLILTFNDTLIQGKKTFSVFNAENNMFPIKDEVLIPFEESRAFEGLTLYTEDFNTSVDYSRSRWNNQVPNLLGFIGYLYLHPNIPSYAYPNDYCIAFSDTYNDTSYSLYKIFGGNVIPNKNVNFRVYDITNKNVPKDVQFAFGEMNTFRVDTLSFDDLILISNSTGDKLTWNLIMTGDYDSYVPHGGDTLYIITNKGLSIYDTLMISGLTSDVENETKIVSDYSLNQNYPNPFNPSTIISYQLPKKSNVKLQIYDILGKEILTLVDKEQDAGSYKVSFNARKLASGVYIYQLRAGEFVSSRKLMLMK